MAVLFPLKTSCECIVQNSYSMHFDIYMDCIKLRVLHSAVPQGTSIVVF